MTSFETQHNNAEIAQEVSKELVNSSQVSPDVAATDLVDERKEETEEKKEEDKTSKSNRIATDRQRYVDLGYKQMQADRMAKNFHTGKELSKKERKEIEAAGRMALGIFDKDQAYKYVQLLHKKTNAKETIILNNLNRYKDDFIKEVNEKQALNKKDLETLRNQLPDNYKQKVGKPIESQPGKYAMPIGNYPAIAKMSESERNPRQQKIFSLGQEVVSEYNTFNRNKLFQIFEGVDVYAIGKK